MSNMEKVMSARDVEWLTAHNVRRQKYHIEYGKRYVPLKWSPQLAAQAKQWANQLLGDCDIIEIKHQPGIDEGENLQKNKGSGEMSKLYTADKILNRWVEREMDDGYPDNAHLTQVCHADFLSVDVY